MYEIGGKTQNKRKNVLNFGQLRIEEKWADTGSDRSDQHESQYQIILR